LGGIGFEWGAGMTVRRIVAGVFLAVLLAASFGSLVYPRLSYSIQNREFLDAAPSAHFPLGTDELGRDRLARLLYASRFSLLFAAAASLGSLVLAALLGGLAGYWGGWVDRCLVRAIDLMLSLPWLFLLLAARAMLPLNASPVTSLLVTYALLALLGWASPARVVRAGVRSFRDSEFVLQARAEGLSEARILWRQVLPNLRPILLAQFWTAIPVFILTEANLGFLGLSAGEPFPTWGSLLRELQSPLFVRPEAFAPVAAITLSVCCFRLMSPKGRLHI
jgi:ABC-type dipeptide/oligopeptide/nickel transport system permease subunit